MVGGTVSRKKENANPENYVGGIPAVGSSVLLNSPQKSIKGLRNFCDNGGIRKELVMGDRWKTLAAPARLSGVNWRRLDLQKKPKRSPHRTLESV